MVQKEILEVVTDEKLKVYVVWTPVLQEDDRQAAVKAIGYVPDERAIHFWDADKSPDFWRGKTVTLPRGREPAWDVYLAFDVAAEWVDGVPKSAYWMHQLGTDERKLSGDTLRVSIEKLLRTFE